MQDYDRSHVKSADILRPATPQQILVSVAIALLAPQRRLFLSNSSHVDRTIRFNVRRFFSFSFLFFFLPLFDDQPGSRPVPRSLSLLCSFFEFMLPVSLAFLFHQKMSDARRPGYVYRTGAKETAQFSIKRVLLKDRSHVSNVRSVSPCSLTACLLARLLA